MNQYEYKIVSIRDYPPDRSGKGTPCSGDLSEFGKEGWRLHKIIDKDFAVMERKIIK